MVSPTSPARRCILGVFAHPDDETTSSAGTFALYAKEGVEIFVATATRGELGTITSSLGSVEREQLPFIRKSELRKVLESYGAHPPILLDYRDQEVSSADFEELVGKVGDAMDQAQPDVVITFGPNGITKHEDHMAVHRATVEAYHRRLKRMPGSCRLFYVAIRQDVARQIEFDLHETEKSPTILIDITAVKATKIRALRMYKSQEDAQQVAEWFESDDFNVEAFHQAFPPWTGESAARGFWE